MPSATSQEPDETWQTASPLTLGVGCGTFVAGALLLLVIAAFVYAVFRSPTLGRLRDADQLVALFANLVVVFFAFPAFSRTKKRPFLALAFAALAFAYGGLFTLLLGGAPSSGSPYPSRSQLQWYYASRHVVNILGMLLYAYGIISLARHTVAPSNPKT